MQTWTHLARLALIGTEHQPPVPPVLGDAALDEMLANLGSIEERESYVLKSAGVLALARRAGYRPVDQSRPTPAAAPETQPRCPQLAGHDLARLLGDYLPQVLPEWLDLAGARGFRVPEDLLPDLLDHARGKSHLHAPVRGVLGQRGAWLAAQNPDWSFAVHTGGDEKAWHEGKRAERLAALREIRQANPARALELLAASWKNEPPEDRAEFIQILRTGLSLQDEAFLDAALDDKRKEVRVHAVLLLSSLPDSQLVRRLIEWATPLLRLKKQLLRAPVLELDLPAECTREMKRYGLGSSTPPDKEIGEKAWLVSEMLQGIPPGYWSQALRLTPQELIEAAIKSEWAKVLLTGWSRALGRYHDRTWVEAWMEKALKHQVLLDYLPASAVSGFSAADLEALLVKFSSKDKAVFNAQRIVSYRVMIASPWGEALSIRLLTEAQSNLTQYEADYSARARWQHLLRAISLGMPPQLPQATSGWPKEIEQNQIREIIDEFCAVIEFRRALHRHFKGEN